jgi:hypothetical protein
MDRCLVRREQVGLWYEDGLISGNVQSMWMAVDHGQDCGFSPYQYVCFFNAYCNKYICRIS